MCQLPCTCAPLGCLSNKLNSGQLKGRVVYQGYSTVAAAAPTAGTNEDLLGGRGSAQVRDVPWA